MTRWLLGGSVALALLTACGTTRTERGLSGGAIGAGVGAAAGEVFGDSPGKGALLGGAAGAAGGVLSADDDDDDNWRDDDWRDRERSYDEDECVYDRTRGRYYCDDRR